MRSATTSGLTPILLVSINYLRTMDFDLKSLGKIDTVIYIENNFENVGTTDNKNSNHWQHV